MLCNSSPLTTQRLKSDDELIKQIIVIAIKKSLTHPAQKTWILEPLANPFKHEHSTRYNYVSFLQFRK
jgi:hypothetical protein